MTENFIRTEGGSENLTVRTIRHDAICYKLWSNSKAHAKTIIEKRILIVKPFEEGCWCRQRKLTTGDLTWRNTAWISAMSTTGWARSLIKRNSKEVCQVCGAFGLIKKQESSFEEGGNHS